MRFFSKILPLILFAAPLATAGEKYVQIVPPRCFHYIVLKDCKGFEVPNYVDRGGIITLESRVDRQANNFTKFRPAPDQMECKARVKFTCTEISRAYEDRLTHLPVPVTDHEPDLSKLGVNRAGLRWLLEAQ